MDLAMIKAIIQALRTDPLEPGIYRDEGLPLRRQGGTIKSAIKAEQDDTNYARYRKLESDIGDTPVSYEEWMRGR